MEAGSGPLMEGLVSVGENFAVITTSIVSIYLGWKLVWILVLSKV